MNLAKKRRNSHRKGPKRSLRTSVIWLIVLLCLFFVTGTHTWLSGVIKTAADYADIDIDAEQDFSDLLHNNPVANGLEAILENFGGGRGEEAVQTAAGEMAVHILDVGQGSACLVESEGHYMLIDGGPRDSSSYVVAYLRDQGVETLDYIIASHYDADHISGLVGALNVYPTGKILCPDYEADTKIYASLMEKIASNGCEVIHPQAGEVYTIGEAVFSVVAPAHYGYEDENNDSIGIRLVHGGNSFLLLGDAEKESEADICSGGWTLRSDVYFVSHHGSSSSTTEALLSAVGPSVAVISAGKDNSYGHPHVQTMERLEDAGVQLYRTDIQGTITVVSDGETLKWSQEPCTDFSSGSQ